MEASHTVEEEELNIKPYLPTMTVEKGHKILSHRSIRSLLAGSINEVWADYRFIASPDEYCENCKIAASKVQAASKKTMHLPQDIFKCLFMDIIPHPYQGGIDKTTTFPYSLLIVEPVSKFKWFHGMFDASSEELIITVKQYLEDVHALNIPEEIAYIRTDAGTQFMSEEFQDFCRENKFKLTHAASKHQEMNAYSESTWCHISTMSRSMMVHADLSLHFWYEDRRYAVEILNIIPSK